MIKLIYIFILMCFFSSAQPTALQWIKTTGSAGDDFVHALTTDASGNVYVTGVFYNTVDFDPGPSVFNLTSAGNYDAFVLKLNAAGNFVWAVNMGGSNYEVPWSIDLDASGNIYTTGYFEGTSDFDPGAGSYTLTSTGNDDVFISKLDPSGSFLWAKTVGASAASETGKSITVDPSGNVIVTGTFYSSPVDFDPGPGVYNLISAGSLDVFLLKLDPSGNFIWARNVCYGTGIANGNVVATDATGNIFVGGNFVATPDFDPSASTFTISSVAGTSDIYISKFDATGNFVWVKSIGGTETDNCLSLVLDAAGNIYHAGSFGATPDFDPNVGVYNLTSNGFLDVYVSKLDASGNFLFAKSFGGSLNEGAYGIDRDAAGNIYTTGYFYGTSDFDPGASTYTLTSAGNNDIFVSGLDPSGNFMFAKSFSGSLFDNAFDIEVDVSGNIITGGQFYGTVDFDPNAGVFNATSAGNYDIFINKLGPCLAPVANNITPSINQTICANNTGTLLAGGSGTISWYSSPTSTLVLGTGTVFITSTLSAGTFSYYAEALTCTISISRSLLTLTVLTLPSINISSSNSLVCIGNPVALTAIGANSYLWNTSATTTVIVVSPMVTTSYSVIGTDSYGCSNSAIITQSVDACTNIKNNMRTPENIIKIYPNPNKGNFIVELSEGSDICVLNCVGQIIYKEKITNEKQQIDLSNQPNGIYFLQISNTISRQAFKLMKE